MKTLNFTLYIFLSIFIFSCSTNTEKQEITTDVILNPNTANGVADTSDLPIISFKEEFFDFGIIIQGEKVSHTFRFTNEGKSTLIISNVHAGCGCTVPKFSKDPIAPGGQGEIEVTFDSSGRSGMQSKNVTVSANTQPSQIELHFVADVVVPK